VRRPILLLAAVLLGLLAAMAAKSLLVEVPPLRPQSVAGQFDANRAKARLAFILGDEMPHPADSDAGDVVRARLVSLLSGMGLNPLVRDNQACNELYKQRGVSCARVRNVIAVIGPPAGRALLLNAHYDSTPAGPAAADDGAGVATLLEVAALMKGSDLKRPIIFLFNEGEELGLVGARAFLSDPLSPRVDSLVNLEARGVRGPVNMFETSRPNGAAIHVFSAAVDRPFANSLSTDVYRLMPNYTDVNSFSERGWLTLNLAPIGNETRYHSRGDDLAALEPATLQHMGDQTLALARELAAGTPKDRGDRIFMDLAGRILVSLPLALGAVLLAALLIGFGALSRARGGMARGIAVVLGTLIGSGLLSWLAVTLIGIARPGMFWRAHAVWTHLAAYASALLVAAILLATVGRRAEIRQLRAACWLVFLALGGLIGLIAPGGIVFFLFPPLVALAGIIAARAWQPAEPIGSALAVLFLYLSWGAMLGLLEELLSSGPMWVFAPLGSLILLPALIETKPLIDRARLRGAAIAAGAIALVAWAAAAAAPAYSADRKQMFVIEHVTDAASGKSFWSVRNGGAALPRLYRERAKWRWDKLPYSEQKRWLADASAVQKPPVPSVDRLGIVANGRQRIITLRLRSNGAERLSLVAPEDSRIRAAGTAGFVRPIDSTVESGKYALSCTGRSCDGMAVQIVTDSPKPVEFLLVGIRSGLPLDAQPWIAGRPKFAQPQYAPNQTIAFARVKL
jgi:hypothetical protein